MMPALTPGLRYLLYALPKLLGPPFILYIALSAAEVYTDFTVPYVSNWFASIAAYFLWILLRMHLSSWAQRREAWRMGAVQVPSASGKLPGNIDGMMELAKSFDVEYLGEGMQRMYERVGTSTIMFHFFWRSQIFTIEPEHVKQILATEFNNFHKGDESKEQLHSVLGVGVFNSDGDMWRFHRSMTRPFFARERISDFDTFGRHADALLGSLVSRVREGYAIDVQDALSRFTLDSATEFLFGRCVHALRQGLPYPESSARLIDSDSKQVSIDKTKNAESQNATAQFGDAFAEALKIIGDRGMKGPLWSLWELWGDHTESSMRIVRAFVYPILEEAIRKKREREAQGEIVKKDEIREDETLLDYLVKHTDDPTILRDETINILIAGRDTTAATLTFAMYLLAECPESMLRLRSEILEHVGPTRKPTYDDIRAMKYLRAVINETLRLYPPVPFDGRTSIKATTFVNPTPGGKPWYIPPNSGAGYSVFLMHRRKDLWGPDAEEFDPDRFLDERLHKYLTPNPFIFCPFNAGPRICLGQQYAYNEVSFMLVRLLQKFDTFELDSAAQPQDSLPPPSWKDKPGRQGRERIFPKTHLTMYAYKGLWMRLRESQDVQE